MIPDEKSRTQEGRGKKAGHACSKCKQTRLCDAKLTMPVDQTKRQEIQDHKRLSLRTGK